MIFSISFHSNVVVLLRIDIITTVTADNPSMNATRATHKFSLLEAMHTMAERKNQRANEDHIWKMSSCNVDSRT